MHPMLTDDNPFAEQALIKRLRVWLTVLSGVVAIALWMNLEASHPGTMAQLPSILKGLGMAIWTKLFDFAETCATHSRNFVNSMIR